MERGALEYPVDSGCDIGDLAVGGRFVSSAGAEQGLEGSHRRAPAVVAEDELVEVDLQVLGGGAPGCELGGRESSQFQSRTNCG
jgi:hypothetical protein